MDVGWSAHSVKYKQPGKCLRSAGLGCPRPAPAHLAASFLASTPTASAGGLQWDSAKGSSLDNSPGQVLSQSGRRGLQWAGPEAGYNPGQLF